MSLFWGASAFKGVIVAEATAFAAYKKLSILFFSVCVYTKDFDKRRQGGCLRDYIVYSYVIGFYKQLFIYYLFIQIFLKIHKHVCRLKLIFYYTHLLSSCIN